MYPESRSTTYIGETIVPKDIKVFYEDGKPYVEYRGIVKLGNDEYEIEIPKMDMILTGLESVIDQRYVYAMDGHGCKLKNIGFQVCNEVHAYQNINFRLKLIKRSMKKNDIEKELGYQIDIVD